MEVLAINGTYRPKGTTTRLTDRALKGAAAEGAETEHVPLVEKDIRYCANCQASSYAIMVTTPAFPSTHTR